MELREGIREAIQEAWDEPRHRDTWGAFKDSAADKILALIKQAGYVKLADDQSLPECPYVDAFGRNPHKATYKRAQRDMLKAGFRKVEL